MFFKTATTMRVLCSKIKSSLRTIECQTKKSNENYSEGFSNDCGWSVSFEKRTVSKSSSVMQPSSFNSSGWTVTKPVRSSPLFFENVFWVLNDDWPEKKPFSIILAATINKTKTEMPYTKGKKLLNIWNEKSKNWVR